MTDTDRETLGQLLGEPRMLGINESGPWNHVLSVSIYKFKI